MDIKGIIKNMLTDVYDITAIAIICTISLVILMIFVFFSNVIIGYIENPDSFCFYEDYNGNYSAPKGINPKETDDSIVKYPINDIFEKPKIVGKSRIYATCYEGCSLWFYANPQEKGKTYFKILTLKNHKITKSKKCVPSNNQGYSDNPKEKFLYDCEGVDLELGPKNQKYPGKIELWFKPRGFFKKEKMLVRDYFWFKQFDS